MSWQSEHGEEYNVPKRILRLVEKGELSDNSWHNDVCPSFVRKCEDGAGITIWVEHPNPDMREMSGPRFLLTVHNNYEEDASSEADFEWRSDKVNEVIRAYKDLVYIHNHIY